LSLGHCGDHYNINFGHWVKEPKEMRYCKICERTQEVADYREYVIEGKACILFTMRCLHQEVLTLTPEAQKRGELEKPAPPSLWQSLKQIFGFSLF